MTRALLGLAAIAATAAAITAGTGQPADPREIPPRPAPPAPAGAPAARVTPAPPVLGRETINHQDRTSRARRRREAAAFDARPLLTRLPLELAGVRIDLAGLAPDGHTTTLAIDPGSRSRPFARRVYRRALATYRDPGRSYRLRWQP